MEPCQKRVLEFHRAFNQAAPSEYTPLDARTLKLRAELILEEALEFCAAAGLRVDVRQRDLTGSWYWNTIQDIDDVDLILGITTNEIEMIDALCDINYVVAGTAVAMGLDLQRYEEEIHRSNMSKLGADGRPILREDGKVMKGPNYSKPDVAGVLFDQVKE